MDRGIQGVTEWDTTEWPDTPRFCEGYTDFGLRIFVFSLLTDSHIP